MQWLDFPALAEFSDRWGIVRPIYGMTVFGRFEFADRMTDLQTILDESPEDRSWAQLYVDDLRFRNLIAKALGCWGIDIEWLALSQIEQLLFARGEECGWLIELSKPKESSPEGKEAGTLAETITIISSHCQSLTEALELANTVPSDLLVDITRAKAVNQTDAEQSKNPQQSEQERNVRANYKEIMSRFEQE
jgi:hypothetical protein